MLLGLSLEVLAQRNHNFRQVISRTFLQVSHQHLVQGQNEREREREIERENLQGQNETHFECGQRKNRNIRIESEQGLPQCKTWQVKSEACSETSTPRPQHRWSFVTRIHTCVDTPTSHVIRKSITAHRTINVQRRTHVYTSSHVYICVDART